MNKERIVDILVAAGFGFIEACEEATRLIEEARSWRIGETHTYANRHTGEALLTITKN